MMLHPGAPLGALAALAGAVLIYLTRQGTLGGAAAGLLVALVIVAGFGVPGFVPLGIFVLGSGLLTRMGSRRKERTGAAEPNRGRRDERHVGAGVAAGAGFLASALESLFAATSWGTRVGHFGRNVALTVASALLALSARALGWVAS